LEVSLLSSKKVIVEAWEEFGRIFGRYYHPIETYRTEDASTILITMGSATETAMLAVDSLRDKGQKVGLVYIRLWRPFPHEEFFEAVREAKVIAVLDRAISYGMGGGPVFSEVKASLYNLTQRPYIKNFVAGLGGRDIPIENFIEMVDRAEFSAANGLPPTYEHLDVREE